MGARVYNGPRVVKFITAKINNFWSKIIFEQKSQKYINHAKFMPNYACHKHHLHWFAVYYLTKASCKISASSLKDFLGKGRKSLKNAWIMHNYAH